MPTLDVKAPAPASIRERALRGALIRRAGASAGLLTLQEYQASGLSPFEYADYRRREAYYQNVYDHSSDLIKQIRAQNRAIADDKSRRALQPARDRDLDPHRSQSDRNAAILGILERERRRNASLSREAYARAKAQAASRSRYDLKQAYRISGTAASKDASFKGEASFYDLRGVDMPVPGGVDPCDDYCRKQKNRREVMFAKKLIAGYRVSHRPSDCVCP